MAKRDYKIYNFRLNLNNPNHMKIYRVFQDLNKEIHKSQSNFITSAILYYIGAMSDEALIAKKAEEQKNKEAPLTKKDLELIEAKITANVLKEVVGYMSKAALSAQIMNGTVNKELLQESRKGFENTQEDEETDAALEEMSLLFTTGKFGEEE